MTKTIFLIRQLVHKGLTSKVTVLSLQIMSKIFHKVTSHDLSSISRILIMLHDELIQSNGH